MLAKFSRPFTIAATLIGISFGIASTASANNHYDRVDRIAVRVQKRAQQLLDESDRYRYTPVYGQMVQNARLLRDTAIHIHDVTHFEGNLYQLKRDVALVDQAYCSLDLLLEKIEYEAARSYSKINVNPRRARNLLNQIKREVHYLSDELISIGKLAYKPRPQVNRYPVPKPVVKFNTYSSRYKPYSGSRKTSGYATKPYKVNRGQSNRTALGISIGGGSTRIRIGF